jgi:hypothetical protein
MTDLQVEYLEVTDIAAELILTEMGIRLLVKMSDLTLDLYACFLHCCKRPVLAQVWAIDLWCAETAACSHGVHLVIRLLALSTDDDKTPLFAVHEGSRVERNFATSQCQYLIDHIHFLRHQRKQIIPLDLSNCLAAESITQTATRPRVGRPSEHTLAYISTRT